MVCVAEQTFLRQSNHEYDISVGHAWHRREMYRSVSGIVERHLDVPIGRVAERELWSGSWMYIQGEWLRGNCGAAIECTYRASD